MITGNLQNIIAQTRSGDGTVVSMADILKEGFITGEGNDEQMVLDNQGVPRHHKGGLKVNYAKLASDSKSFQTQREYTYTTPYSNNNYVTAVGPEGWYKRYDSGNDYYLVDGKWEAYVEKINSLENNCAVVSLTASGAILSKYCATRKELSGKKVSDFITDVCKDKNDQPISGCNVNEAFPEGTFGYDMQFTALSDQIRIWLNSGSTGFYNDRTMSQLIARLTSSYVTIGWSSADIQIKSYDATNKVGVIKWRKHNTTPFTEETNFVILDLNGIKVLKYENSKLFRELDYTDDLWGIFAEFKNPDGSLQIERGDFYPKNMRQSLLFNGKTKIGNTKVLDTYIKMRNMPAYPY
jgi:hypothetical protein